MRAGVIDIGSSSIKLIIGEKEGEDFRILESLKNAIPIGKNTFLRDRISQEIINQTITLLEQYKQTLKEYEVADIRVIATTAVREARNKNIFLDTVLRKTGFKIEILTAGDVIYYLDTYLSHRLKKTYPVAEKNLLIIELGTGSLDVSILEKGNTLINMGLPIGTLRLKQLMSKLDGSSEEIYSTLQEFINNEIMYVKKMIPGLVIDDLILIDENYSIFLESVLGIKKRETNFFQLKNTEAEEFLTKSTEGTPDSLARTYKIPKETADTIASYAIILNTLFNLTSHKHIYIFQASLSQAILANILFNFELLKENNRTLQLISVAHFICKKYNLDIDHSKHVALLSETLFTHLKEILGLLEKDLLYLTLASYLHDIGIFINNRSHHKHSEYVINSLNLFRLSEEEIKVIGCVARYHRKGLPSDTHVPYSSLTAPQQILVQKLSALLRIANSFDRSHKQKVKNLDVKISKRQDITLTVQVKESFLLEKAYFLENKELFEDITGNKLNLSIQHTP